MTNLTIAVAGAGGRMGAAVIRAALAAGVSVHSAFDRQGSAAIGKDAGTLAGIEPLGVAVGDDIAAALSGAQAIIDFTTPSASVMLARHAAEHGMIHICGTTGFTPGESDEIAAAARAGARIVKSGNFSLGVNLLAGLVRQAARALPGFDIEIFEMHHNRKVDAPSGTALLLGDAAAAGRDAPLADLRSAPYDGHTGPRLAGSIGFATLRGGTVVGEHSVILAGDREMITLSHRADDRAIFANGAVRAAIWAAEAGRPSGLYDMADVLGLKD
jgi:4-hydroxy-tetrahydrodipicolinate reductase